MSLDPKAALGFLGAGNMAEALIRGLLAAGLVEPRRIFVSDLREERAAFLQKELDVKPLPSNTELVLSSDLVILAVKPQNLRGLLQQIGTLTHPGQLWLTILAGIPAARIEQGLQHEGNPLPRVVRAMPNTPALIQMGATAVAAGAHATPADVQTACQIMDAVGVVTVVDHAMLDAVTGLTGSGPAYIFRLIEALIEAADKQGLPRAEAERLIKQMVVGAATLARDSAEDPSELRRRVTSPGGTTEAGLRVLDERHFTQAVIDAVEAATNRSAELGKA